MIQFFRGPKKGYSQKDHGSGIYFATDTKEIIANGSAYTGPVEEKQELGWVEVVGSIEEAFTTGGMATLTENKEISEALTVKEGVNAVLNLNGCSIINSNVNSSKNFAIIIEKGASLVIEGEGMIHGGQGADNLALMVYGDCTIKSGTFMVGPDSRGQGNSCVYVKDGDLKILGGTFSTEMPYNGKYFVLNKKDGSDSNIEVLGGTFINYDPSNSMTEDPAQNFVASGYESVRIGDSNNYQVVKIK
jgi:hypothetical protein